ncbi:MAG: dTDP-4-dehydrorhamnose 3,5-epimerase family protein [Candidatus Aenigmarchaeota archaeon]|nr:dTDP-4-dehydrorhamnose 3,5-epimerase family protein [Candidatus Aenigmarchaeota archaeon]
MINDVELKSLKTNTDERGYLIVFASLGRPDVPDATVKETYLVYSPKKGTIRAFHKHMKMWDSFFVLQGKVKFVLVDERPDSTTYKKIDEIILSEKEPKLLIVPPNVQHGHITMVDDTKFVGLASKPYDKDNPDYVRVPPDYYGDVWKITE